MCIRTGSAVAQVVLEKPSTGTDIRVHNLNPARKSGSVRRKTVKKRVASGSGTHSRAPQQTRSNLLSSLPKPAGPGMKLMRFDMREYTNDTVTMYTKVTGCIKLKKARAPFLNESSLPKADEEAVGELKPNASQCLMKALWLARLARPDVSKAINDLTTKVQSWSRNYDRRL